jgi:hypothetical protein
MMFVARSLVVRILDQASPMRLFSTTLFSESSFLGIAHANSSLFVRFGRIYSPKKIINF